MQKRSRLKTIAAARQAKFAAAQRAKGVATREEDELALLAEFIRHDSVASLAGAIAARLGGNARQAELIDRADLDPTRAGR